MLELIDPLSLDRQRAGGSGQRESDNCNPHAVICCHRPLPRIAALGAMPSETESRADASLDSQAPLQTKLSARWLLRCRVGSRCPGECTISNGRLRTCRPACRHRASRPRAQENAAGRADRIPGTPAVLSCKRRGVGRIGVGGGPQASAANCRGVR